MRRTILSLLMAIPVVIAWAVPSNADADHRSTVLKTAMTGAQEVPTPGDADGSGFAVFVVQPSQGRLCYVLQVRDVAPVAAAHIHRAPVGVAAPPLIPLEPPTDGHSTACTDVDPALLMEIVTSPADFYVNVHNADFPSGALRGQLG